MSYRSPSTASVITLIALVGCIPEPADVSNPLVLENGGRSYLSDVLRDGRLMRFSKTVITVSVDTKSVPSLWKSDYADYVDYALAEWEEAAAGAFRFTRVDRDGDIRVSWVNSFNNGNGSGAINSGQTTVAADDFRFDPPRVVIALAGLSDDQIYTTTVHELGHALGIDGHSPHGSDLMAAYGGPSTLSPNDVATLRDLYSRPAQITNY